MAVGEINRLVATSTQQHFRVGLTDYGDQRLSPVRSNDLISAAEHPEENPFFPYFNDRLASLLPTLGDSPLIGFSLNYLSQALCTASFVGVVRQEIPSATIVLGGGLITSWMSSPTWRNPFAGLVDRLVAGPGENVLLSMVGESADNGRASTFSFDRLPLGDYFSPGPIIPYSASTGCYWRHCSFCPERSEGNPYSANSPGRVISEIETLADETNPSLIHIVDNALSPSLLNKIAGSPLPVPWYGFCRITAELCDRDFCRSLKESGCVMVKLGIESGDQDVLDSLHKGATVEMASRCLSALSEAGIATYVYLLFGTPTEDERAARKTLDFASRHSVLIDYLNLAVFNMPLHSPDTAHVSTKEFYEGDLSLYTDFVHPHGWGRKEVRQFLDRDFKRDPQIRPIILRQPPQFTSNHAPFFRRDKGWSPFRSVLS
jgi:radical SAM superfamily enzyme YgiQ (UPF0313 family)